MHLTADRIALVCHLVRSCGQTAQRLSSEDFQVYEKGRHDYVTDVDRRLDRQLTIGLTTLFPTESIITEERPASWSAYQEQTNRLWLVDPLDGTDDFIQGSLHYAVMVGLLANYEPIAGWIYAPVFDELYYGGPDFGLFHMDTGPAKRLQPIPPPPPTAHFCPIILGYKDQRQFGAAIQQVIPAVQFDNIGSFGLKVLQVVLGKAGLYLYLNRRVKLWDTTGPLAIAQAAGLICCDLSGRPLRFTPDAIDSSHLSHQQPIVVGWPQYVETVLPRLQQAVSHFAFG